MIDEGDPESPPVAVRATPLDRTIARQAFQRFAEMPKYRDIRRHFMRRYVDGNRLFINIPTKSPPRQLYVWGHKNIVYGDHFVLNISTKAEKCHFVFYDLELMPGLQIATIHTQIGQMVGAYTIEPADGTPLYEIASRTSFANIGLDPSGNQELGKFAVSELGEIVCAGRILNLPLTPHDYLQFSYAESSDATFAMLAKQAEVVIHRPEDERMEASRIYSECGALLRSRTLREFVQSFCGLDLAAIERILTQNMILTKTAESTFAERAWARFFGYLTCAIVNHPRVTELGLRLPYCAFHKREGGYEISLSAVEIAADQLADDRAASIELAKDYWQAVGDTPFYQDGSVASIRSPTDVFLSGMELRTRVTEIEPTLQGSEADWQTFTTGLVDECLTLKQWTIPWSAYVEIDYLGFSAVELFENGDSVACLWRSPDGKTTWSIFRPRHQAFQYSHEVPGKAQAHWNMFIAALIRDFWVVEERRKVFAVSLRRMRRGNHGKREARIIYLPRVRYDQSMSHAIGYFIDRSEARTRHFVRPFFRKVNPTPIQVEVARLNNVIVPEGHTYVRGHFRGGAETAAIYRSRSATQLLFRTTAPTGPETTLETDWFSFELLVGTLLKAQGFEIQHRATQGKADDGVDIVALQRTGQSAGTWLVQAKCYAPDRPVGPDTIREMMGSIADFGRRHPGQHASGMIVTTSRFTGEAQRFALAHGIKLVDGANLQAIAAVENARSVSPTPSERL
jgi:hypothetical protein